MREMLIGAVVLGLASGAQAGVFKCLTDEGIVYSDRQCDGTAIEEPIGGVHSVIGEPLRRGELRALREVTRDMKRRPEGGAAVALPHATRLRIRELEMERSDLRDRLDRGGLTRAERRGVVSEIRQLERRIDRLANGTEGG